MLFTRKKEKKNQEHKLINVKTLTGYYCSEVSLLLLDAEALQIKTWTWSSLQLELGEIDWNPAIQSVMC